ncbi:phosphate acetyltransferase [candidate division KSB1 bacterium]
MIRKKEALEYHFTGRHGKIEVISSKPCLTQRDLSLAYTPGVAEPVKEIVKNPEESYNYTAKGNLVAVVTNGTAVLGLGDVGGLASKPVMEGKGVLFKRFADIDVFDIEINSKDPDDVINVCKLLEPTFGGINLEDIKAPECFYIEERLKEEMNIPVFHDDQHGTAIITSAALLNALEIVGKKIDKVKMVVNGAGAAGFACTSLFVKLGIKKENIIICDSKGVIYKGRKEGLNPYKERFAVKTVLRTLEEAMKGCDVFVGLSVAGAVSKDMVKSMNDKPIIFALANPDPEITYEDAKSVRDDIIMGTGRSDYPNQVNNVLGFPFIFRGALDVRAKAINDEMKMAAVYALASLTKEVVPESVVKAYEGDHFEFGPNYIIPKPFDPRILIWEASAVAEAAMDTGVATIIIDIEKYKEELDARLGRSRIVMRGIINKAKKEPKKIVFPEGDEEKIIKAAHILVDEKIAKPILLGNEKNIETIAEENHFDLDGIEIINPSTSEKLPIYIKEFYNLRNRYGVTEIGAREYLEIYNYFGSMMVHMGDADGLISGLTKHYPNTIRPALQIIKMEKGIHKVSGLYMMIIKNKLLFFADTTVNIEPTSEDLAEIAICAAETVKKLDIEPRVAMLSFSNFGSVNHPFTEKVKRAVEIVKERKPELMIDGEMQADTAVVWDIIEKYFPFSDLKDSANILIFPDLQSGNIAYKLLARLGGATAIGPILMGIKKSVHVLQRGCEVADIINMASIAVVDAQERQTAFL